MDKNTPVTKIKGVGEKTTLLFDKIGIQTCNDLIHYYPRSYDKYEIATGLIDSKCGERNAIIATVKSMPKIIKYNGRSVVSFFIYDKDGVCEVKFFNSPFMAKAFKPGDKKVFRGFLKAFKDKIIMDQPKVYSLEDYSKLEGKIVPLYPLIKDLTNERILKSVKAIINEIDKPSDYLTDEECTSMSMINLKKALEYIHFPLDENTLYLSRRRIIFDEFMDFVRLSKENVNEAVNVKNTHPMIRVADCQRLMDNLPYSLTNAQQNAIEDIFKDLEGEFVMNRLVQGDVGSGKTIVAVMSLLMTVANGYQGAMMAPTEVLARQHYEFLKGISDKYNLCIKPVLLTGKMGAKDKRESLKMILSGEANVVLGTHAIIQEGVDFKNLALVITDEQHRFGVKQREELKNKGSEPHLLVMSATPIPRTLCMIVFAGLSVSVIDELPKNRIPISNCVVNSSYREKAYEKIRAEIANGHQAYVICPMVSDSEEDELGLKSVEKHSKDIKDYFGDSIRVGSLNGKMKPEEKTRIMESFKERNIDILVSTTVIEVGIDVPNATVILIENAERFGLSTLHQLRGRVGRGSFPSFCILLSDTKNNETLKRLKILNDTNDGFKIANEDMKLRGPGELNGIRQSGELQFGLGDITADGDLFMLAATKYDLLKDRLPRLNTNLIDFRTI